MFGNERISPELLLLAGSSLAGGQTVGQQLGGIGTNVAPLLAQQAEQRKQMEAQNKTLQYLKQTNPQLAAQVEAGMPVSEAWQQVVQAQQPKKSEFKVLPDGTYGAWDGQKFNTLGNAQKPTDLPAIADEYNWMKTQGFKGTPQEYQAWKSSLSKTGMMVENDGNGNFRMVQGDPSTFPTKPLTEGQSKDQNYFQRAQQAESNLVPVENELTSWAQKRATGLPFDMGNYLKSDAYQKAQQAGKEVLAVILRKDTGAAVTPQEFEEYGSIYLPQPGEGKDVIDQKRLARQTVIKAIKDGLPEHVIQKLISQGVNVDPAQTPDAGVVSYTDFFK
jgi:hypothetical protein